MSTQRITARWRALGKSALAGVLMMSLFVSVFASASPSLHRWLHADHQAPSHYCLVTVLEHGQTEVVSVWVAVVPVAAGIPVAALPTESFFISHDVLLFPERGPPVLS